MKVAQNDVTNPDTQPVRPPHIPSIANMELSPFVPPIRKCKTRGILSRMFPPPLLPLHTETVSVAAALFNSGVDDPSLSAELLGKPPLDHQISPIFLYTLALE